jgi:hypothetical protein
MMKTSPVATRTIEKWCCQEVRRLKRGVIMILIWGNNKNDNNNNKNAIDNVRRSSPV